MKRFLSVAALVICTGCSLSQPVTSPELLGKCGPRPSEFEAQAAVGMFVQQAGFKDPSSVQTRGIYIVGPVQWNSLQGNTVGWEVKFETNAKNSFGGYTGFKQREVLIQPGMVRWRLVLD